MAEEFDNEHSDNLQELRDAAERGRTAVGENSDLKREMAFLKAGIDTDSKIGGMLLKTYEGELDVEAIRAEANAIPGFLAENQVVDVDETDNTSQENLDLQNLRDNMSTGDAPVGEQVDAPTLAMQEFTTAIQGGASRKDSAAAYFGTLLSEAANGNPTAIFDQAAWNAQIEQYD